MEIPLYAKESGNAIELKWRSTCNTSRGQTTVDNTTYDPIFITNHHHEFYSFAQYGRHSALLRIMLPTVIRVTGGNPPQSRNISREEGSGD
jgi:hypothetical protein